MNRWGVRATSLSGAEKFGAWENICVNRSTPMVYYRMLGIVIIEVF